MDYSILGSIEVHLRKLPYIGGYMQLETPVKIHSAA